MKRFIKRLDAKIAVTIVQAILIAISTILQDGEVLVLTILNVIAGGWLSFLVVDLLIYFSEYRRTANNNAPPYLEWFFKTRNLFFKSVSTVALAIPIILVFLLPTIELYWERVVALLVLYSFAFGMLYQPYTIYKKLIEIDWFNKNDYRVD